jgi:uncharacterized repeat protein (TIGR01451 family)
VSESFSSAQGSQTISFGALSGKAFGSASFSVSATATSGLPVSFASLTASVCTVSNATVTLVALGQCTIEATQAGNNSYAAADFVTQSFMVTGGIGATGVSTLNFPNTLVGTSSALQMFHFQNSGNTALTITSIVPSGSDAANYRYAADSVRPCPMAPATLAAGATCAIDVTFAPLSGGPHNNAQIVITDDSGNIAGSSQSIGLAGTGIVLSSITVSANSAFLASGASEQFTATGMYSDNSTADLTGQAAWGSSRQNIAGVSSSGVVTTILAGQTSITAALGGLTSNSFQLTVTPAAAAAIAVYGGSGQSARVGTTFSGTLQAEVRDGAGDAVPNATVTFSAPSSGASAVFSNGLAVYTTTTNASGIAASLPVAANANAGAYAVTATVTGVTSGASFALTNLKGPILTITEVPVSPFVQGQSASYTITVANAANAGPTSGTMTVTEVPPAGLTLIGLSGGPTWTCNLASASCSTGAVLSPGATSSIAVTLSVPYNGPVSAANSVGVSGGGGVAAIASDPTPILSACSVTLGANTTVTDVQQIVNQALGVSPAANDLNADGKVNIVDLQIVTVAAMGQGCSAS